MSDTDRAIKYQSAIRAARNRVATMEIVYFDDADTDWLEWSVNARIVLGGLLF